MKKFNLKNLLPALFLTLTFGTELMAQQNILISQVGTVSVSNNDNFYDAGGVKIDCKNHKSLSNIMKINIQHTIFKFKTRIGQNQAMKIIKKK